MSNITYEVVEHDGGWAYKVDDVFSETFATRHEAEQAAETAAAEHELTGTDEHIEYEDENGVWHEEEVSGEERPQTGVKH
ncbi:DUF2188 domain-containing protein [Nitratireductor basaltis]|uniref:DUF2188 domain-containing protein n=1 Tax=Nitratireductor basaltis TaxID=472175 RepID=A0A084UAZ3_9HYPH|nr:DUF2188 domain-containing protein [Nitratireductor basaltis]KFB10129.1 hypothetical protein EL18_01159 [Nitratireductor basaltis]